MRIFRLIRIARVAYRYGLDSLVLEHEIEPGLRTRLLAAAQRLMFWRDLSAPRTQVIRDGRPQRIPGREVVRG